MRDITKRHFSEALTRRNIKSAHLGYYHVTDNVSVYARNGGHTRRAQLAYLITEQKKANQEKLVCVKQSGFSTVSYLLLACIPGALVFMGLLPLFSLIPEV